MLRPRIHAPIFCIPRSRPFIIDAGRAAFQSVHLFPRARGDEPLEQFGAANAEGIFQALVRTGGVTIQ